MKNRIAAITVLLLLACRIASAENLVGGSVEAGKARSTTCGACHGADGNSVNPMWPNLAGQHSTYIVAQLRAFKSGKRSDVLMSAQAAMVDDKDMDNLAAYFASQPAAPRAVADPSTVDKGERLYRGGDSDKSIPACMACHGPTGRGNPAAAYPSIHGQYATYTAKQLRDYASGARKSDDPTKIMRDIARRLTEDEILALASYIQGLR
jgi:cytochrome c553